MTDSLCGTFSFCAFPKVLSSSVFGVPKAVSVFQYSSVSLLWNKQWIDRSLGASFLLPFSYRYPEIAVSKCFCLFGLLFGFLGRCWFFFPALMYFCWAEGSSGREPIPKILGHRCRDLSWLLLQASLGIQDTSRSAWGCCPLIKCSWQCLSSPKDRADTSNALVLGALCGGKSGTNLPSAGHMKFDFSNFRVSLRHVGSDCQGVVLKILSLCIFLTLFAWQYMFLFSVPCDSGILFSMHILIAGSIYYSPVESHVIMGTHHKVRS